MFFVGFKDMQEPGTAPAWHPALAFVSQMLFVDEGGCTLASFALRVEGGHRRGGRRAPGNLWTKWIDIEVLSRAWHDKIHRSPTAHQTMASSESKNLTGDSIRNELRTSAIVDQNHPLIIHEFAILGGETRADLVTISDLMHGYEVKGASDNLKRLPKQIELYNRVFDRATLVTTAEHLDGARSILPAWWGLVRASFISDQISLRPIRKGRVNRRKDAYATLSLLWKDELLQVAEQHGLAFGNRSKSAAELVTILSASLAVDRLDSEVRNLLRARGDWRLVARRKSSDVSYRRNAKKSGYRGRRIQYRSLQ